MDAKFCPSCCTRKPISEFWVRKSRDGQPASRCKVCSTEANRAWRKRNPDSEKRRYAKTRAETRERHLIRKYGVTLADYDRMLAEQDGACAICRKAEAKEKHGVLHVDHCHATGAVRGLLCRNCNHVLGLMADDPTLLRAAAAYLVPQIPELIGRAILQAEGRA